MVPIPAGIFFSTLQAYGVGRNEAGAAHFVSVARHWHGWGPTVTVTGIWWGNQTMAETSELLSEAAASKYSLLSPKEKSVLLAAALGAEDKEIAASLGCSVSTVQTLWQRVYRKTGMASRRRLIAEIWEEAIRVAGEVIYLTT